jgi:hypothetical protein
LQADGNLLWGVKARASSGTRGPHDIYADPAFANLSTLDLRLSPRSPAVDAGVEIPPAWPDSLRRADKGKPDIGALPLGAAMLRVGPAAAP